jgi:hypothetical protein
MLKPLAWANHKAIAGCALSASTLKLSARQQQRHHRPCPRSAFTSKEYIGAMYWRTKGQQTFRAIATTYNYFVYPHGCGLEFFTVPGVLQLPPWCRHHDKKMQGFDELKEYKFGCQQYYCSKSLSSLLECTCRRRWGSASRNMNWQCRE